jgi:hypothetical protein
MTLAIVTDNQTGKQFLRHTRYEAVPLKTSVSVTVSYPVLDRGVSGKVAGARIATNKTTIDIPFNVSDPNQYVYEKVSKLPNFYSYTNFSDDPIPWEVDVTDAVRAAKPTQEDIDETNKLNQKYTALNKLESEVEQLASNTNGNSYLSDKAAILAKKEDLLNAGFTIEEAEDQLNNIVGNAKKPGIYRAFYTNNKVTPWSGTVSVSFQDLEKDIKFEPDYYLSTEYGKKAKQAWDDAVANDNVDLLNRFINIENYAKFDYAGGAGSNNGQLLAKQDKARDPGFKPRTEALTYQQYLDASQKDTDDFRQKIRDEILGLSEEKTPTGETKYKLNALTDKLSGVVETDKTATELWNAAKQQAVYAQRFPNEPKGEWVELAESLGSKPSDLENASSFGLILAKGYSLKPEETTQLSSGTKKVIDNIKKVSPLGTIRMVPSQIDVALQEVAGEAEKTALTKFETLQKEFLEETRTRLKEAKRQEQELALYQNTSLGKEVLGFQDELNNSILGDTGIGGLYAMSGRDTKDLEKSMGLNVNMESVFGTKNGMLYNWQDWFNKEIEKKYSFGLDIPDDYVAPDRRTPANGFITDEQKAQWKKVDDAYAELKKNPYSITAKEAVKPQNIPAGYIPVEERKEVKSSWAEYEKRRDESGMSSDQRFAQDFFNNYLKPRFDQSKSMSEFIDYMDVKKGEENIFQTQDRMTSLKYAAEAATSSWFQNLKTLAPSGFNSEFYLDPGGYYKTKGVGGESVLSGEAFKQEWGDTLPERYSIQKQKIDEEWNKAQQGQEGTNPRDGSKFNWQAEAYYYGLDINNKDDFAKLHYQLIGQYDNSYDAAPDVASPEIANIYIRRKLTPSLQSKYAEIGTVFGEFVSPEAYAQKIVDSFDPVKNREEIDKVLKMYDLDPATTDLSQLRDMIAESIKGDNAAEIRSRIEELNKLKEKPTQKELGVEYIQRDIDEKDLEAAEDDKLYGIFKSAGYQGDIDQFYEEFMPDATDEDRQMFNAAYDKDSFKKIFSFSSSSDPFTNLAQIERLSGGESEDIFSMGEKKTTGSRFSYFDPNADTEDEEESSPVKIKRGVDFLNEFKKKSGLTSSSSLSSPFESGFFSSF